jgi:hypothetical protein
MCALPPSHFRDTDAMPTQHIAADARPFDAPRRQRTRSGCLFGCLGQSALALAFGFALLLAINATLYPYAFTLGGHFHPLPYWSGWGRTHVESAGGDYLLFIGVGPWSNRYARYPGSSLRGRAWVCTPKGEMLMMYLGGGMDRIWRGPTVGKSVGLYMNYWPALSGNFRTDHRPSLKFQGHWADRSMQLDDEKTISRAFLSDGTVFRSQPGAHPGGNEIATIDVREGSWSDFKAACSAMGK